MKTHLEISKDFQKIITILIMLAFSGMMLTLINRTENFDDAWFGELAYFLAKDGIIRSNLFADMHGWSERVLMTHKLHVVVTAIWIKIWDFSLYTVKTVVLPFTLFQIWLFRLHSRKTWLLASLLFLCSGVIIRYTFVSRPEIAMASLGFMSWIALQRYNKDQSFKWLFLAAISAGATALFHLQGALYMSAGALWLLWARQFKALIIFSIISFATFLLYFTDVVLYDAWEQFIHQTSNDPATTALRNLSEKIRNLLKIPQMMLHSLGEIPATLLMLGCFTLRKKLNLSISDLEKFLILLFVCFTILANRITHIYIILLIPFMLSYCAEIIQRSGLLSQFDLKGTMGKKGGWVSILLVLHLLSGFVFDAKLLARNLEEESLTSRNQKLQKVLGKEIKTVIAPISFIFDNIENQHIIGQAYYHHFSDLHSKPITVEVFFKDAKRKKVQAVIFENNPVTMEYEAPENIPDQLYGYQLIHRDSRYRVYRLKK